MGANTPARATTAGELTKQRSEGQWSEFHLAIQPTNIVYQARINQTFTSYDNLYELTIDTGSGTLGDILPNMTVLIGSTAGAHDKGIGRVRKAWSSTKAYIGLTSKLRPVDNDYVTVIDATPLWARHPASAGEQIFMDTDIIFGEEQAAPPMPALGPLVAVLRLTGATVDFTPPDPSDLSWSPVGATIQSYAYDAPGASATANMTTTQPTFTYNAPGWYRWSCDLLDSGGRLYTGYRWIVVEPDDVDFEFEEVPIGDASSGGWAFSVKCFSGVTLTDVRDRAMVVLWTTDHFDGVEGSIGSIAGYENVFCIGWIDGQSIDHNPMNETVRFTVRGPAFWFGKIQAYPLSLTDTASAPTDWTEAQELTVDQALARLWTLYSNAAQIMDCIPTGDTNRVSELSAPAANLWNQISMLAEKVFAKPLVNRLGQMFVEVDPQYKTTAARSAMPVIQEITEADWIERLDFDRVTQETASFIELSAIENYDGATEIDVHSRAPGNIPLEYGEPDARQGYIVADQDDCNRLSGAMLAAANNEYPGIPILFASRFVDICPAQWCTLSMAAGDNVRGVSFTLKRLIPRRVALNMGKANKVRWNVSFEAETIGVDGVTYVPPQPQEDNMPDLDIDFDFVDFPGLDSWFPPTIPPDVDLDDCAGDPSAGPNAFSIGFSPRELVGVGGPWTADAYFPCTIRAASADYPTQMQLFWKLFGDAADHVHVYAISGGTPILTGTISALGYPTIVDFAPVGDTVVEGFRITLDEGELAGLRQTLQGDVAFAIGAAIDSEWTDPPPDEAGAELTGMTIGNWYYLTGEDSSPGHDPYWEINAIGWEGDFGNVNIPWSYHDIRPPWVQYSFAKEGEYGYGIIYKAIGSSIAARIKDQDEFSGQIFFVLRPATLYYARRVLIHRALIENVCAA